MNSRIGWIDRPEAHLAVSVLGVGTLVVLIEGVVRLAHWLLRL
jgi:hypothetical protein